MTALGLAVSLLGLLPFLVATTFTGDDHLFLAFSRYVSNPLVAFVRDQHGGEFYRPLPMQIWWILGRLVPGSRLPFALLAGLLHVTAAILTGALVRSVRGNVRMAIIAGGLFFVAPFAREAAYWYSASTDLLATVFGLGTILAVLGRRSMIAMLLFAAACWSKESAIVIPILAALMLRAQGPETLRAAIAKRVVFLMPVLAVYLLSRTIVLHGAGGSGDIPAPMGGKVIQIVAGLVRAGSGNVLAGSLTWTLGISMWVALLVGTARLPGSPTRSPLPWVPLAWIFVSVLPLLAAPWIVGARYFYVAAIGIAWLAAEILARKSAIVTVGVVGGLVGIAFTQTIERRAEVKSYDARLSAARRAVVAGIRDGHTTFHIASGIKDLDLAIKEDPYLSSHEATLLILSDVPASFVALSETRIRDTEFLVARPPLPPAGAYEFGARRIVGLARRGDDPTLDEVVARLPGIRFVRLRLGPGGHIVHRDVTDERGTTED